MGVESLRTRAVGRAPGSQAHRRPRLTGAGGRPNHSGGLERKCQPASSFRSALTSRAG
jgi:hypothetical protein